MRENNFTGDTFSSRSDKKLDRYQIVACKQCGLIRSDPILDARSINTLYVQSDFVETEEAPYAARTYASLTKKLIEKYVSGQISSLLEIGSSTGLFLEEALAMGIQDVIGFEPSQDSCAHAHNAVQSRIINSVYNPEAIAGKSFDLACGFHIIDHLPYPKQTLDSIAQHLKPNGYILLVSHDVESWTAKILGGHSPIFNVQHIYFFSQRTIRMLLESAGFEVLEVGSLLNRYPLGYWLRVFPGFSRGVDFLPGFVKNIPVSVRPGNFYVFGRKIVDKK